MATVVNLLLVLGLLSAGPPADVRTQGLIEREVAFSQVVTCTSASSCQTTSGLPSTYACLRGAPSRAIHSHCYPWCNTRVTGS